MELCFLGRLGQDPARAAATRCFGDGRLHVHRHTSEGYHFCLQSMSLDKVAARGHCQELVIWRLSDSPIGSIRGLAGIQHGIASTPRHPGSCPARLVKFDTCRTLSAL